MLGRELRPVYSMLDEYDEPAAEAPTGDAASGENELVEHFITAFDAEVVIDEEPDQPDERIEETS